jgi:biopolymer transport protein ExbB/biopolymer transport protein TolQ
LWGRRFRLAGWLTKLNQLAGEEDKMLLQMQIQAVLLLQEAAPGWDFRHLWTQMGGLAKGVVVIMFLMSAWSIGVMIDRVMAFNAARKQSRQFAPAVAGALREGKLDEAIKVADRYKKSHLAKVVVAGLQEFQAHQGNTQISGEEIEASRRALERSEAIVHAELKRGVSALATIGSTAPFVGLFGTVVGIINAFKTMAAQKTPGIGAAGAVDANVLAADRLDRGFQRALN